MTVWRKGQSRWERGQHVGPDRQWLALLVSVVRRPDRKNACHRFGDAVSSKAMCRARLAYTACSLLKPRLIHAPAKQTRAKMAEASPCLV